MLVEFLHHWLVVKDKGLFEHSVVQLVQHLLILLLEPVEMRAEDSLYFPFDLRILKQIDLLFSSRICVLLNA